MERGLTQQALGRALHVSDKAVSKWERGAGCPDVSLLPGLSEALGVNIEGLLAGDLAPNSPDGGNMKRVRFYRCPACGNVLLATGAAEVACCGRPLAPLQAQPAGAAHQVNVEPVEDELYVTFPHPMEKGHYAAFLASVGYDRALLVRLYPEQGGEARLPRLRGGKLYLCCSAHGLFAQPE